MVVRVRPLVTGVTLAAVLLAPGCGDDQPGWCDRLEELQPLATLRTAVTEGDGETAAAALSEFREVAADAPEDVRAPMLRLSTVLEEVVDFATGDDTDLEARRERVNQQLALAAADTAEVSAWAEQECGLEL